MLNVQCRLCSSSRALISLFGGKCRRNRDYIRKLVDVTTGIKFQKNDAYKCICFACTVQIYNFYIFRSQSILNENILQASAESNEKSLSNKIEVKSLDDIILPSVNELKETLTPWLTSKQEYCETISNENDKSVDRRNSVSGKCNCYNVHDKQLIENSTQYDSVELIDKSTIYESSSVEVSSQTDKLKTKTVKLQCQLLRTSLSKNSDISTQTSADNIFYNTVDTVNKETQYEVSSIAVYTQTKKLPVKHAKLQCELEKTNSITESKVPVTQHNEGSTCYPKECFNKEIQHEPTTVEVHTQTNNLVTETIKTRKQLEKINRKSLMAKNKESATQTESAKEVICPYLPSELTDNENTDLRTNLRVVDIKEEVANVSPSIPSPMKCLNVNIDSTKNETLASPQEECSSPKSPDLLTIKNKVQSVIICKECDQTIYSKNQYRLHRKSHMRCNFCKERFRSVKKTKLHMQNDCTIQKSIKIEPIVSLARLETITSLQDMYPECFKLLKQFNNTGYNQSDNQKKKVIRIRSRSISSIDSFINCNTCRGCISVLNGISVGVDKSIQVNLFFDKDLMVSPLNYLYENLYLKNCLKQSIEDDGVPIKKIKLSPLENN